MKNRTTKKDHLCLLLQKSAGFATESFSTLYMYHVMIYVWVFFLGFFFNAYSIPAI